MSPVTPITLQLHHGKHPVGMHHSLARNYISLKEDTNPKYHLSIPQVPPTLIFAQEIAVIV